VTNPPIPRLIDRPWFDRRLFIVHRGDPNDAYLRRWTLLRTRWGSLRLHQFLRGDVDTCALHDHPWSFLTLILIGGYREVLPGGVRWRPPGTLLYRPAAFRHRVEVGRPSWSLVWTRQKSRAWGFWTPRGYRPFRQGMTSVCEEARP
jgi:hypothetical protein